MSGFGIRLQPELQRHIADGCRLWRPQSFCHQLSLAGAMLWMPNHDRAWLRLAGCGIGNPGAGWDELRVTLEHMAAGSARRLLWAASARWLDEMRTALPKLERYVAEQGIEPPPGLAAVAEEVKLRSGQVKGLEWCAADHELGRISIVR